ncbi:integrase core domain-containing protein [Wolbachia endosymbiont (group B) of Melanargia galathea]|uniref:integrase core domain-containing protein n=1 Tax=Wolbachia endosymbiont (group B) of Melanargia galathea TaxID=2954029 RepID=UPI00313CC4EE
MQECLKEWKIKFRPIKPFSPHLNGKVERAQRTDLDEFYSSVNIKDYELQVKLRDWEEYYNKQRPHSSLQTPTMD